MIPIDLVISALQAMKQIYDDVQYSHESCKELAKHCEVLSFPVFQIKDNADLIASNSASLQAVLTLLTDCRNFCEKFKGRGFLKTITNATRDKEKFAHLHRRLDSATQSFTLQVGSIAISRSSFVIMICALILCGYCSLRPTSLFKHMKGNNGRGHNAIIKMISSCSSCKHREKKKNSCPFRRISARSIWTARK
jgi:hypothetical protein